MPKTFTFITGNPIKQKLAKAIWDGYDLNYNFEKLETPEIQALTTEEVATYSAKWAAEKLQKPVVVNDVGYYIQALNGFPGPYIKYINKWLTAQDIINLMIDKENRRVEIHDILAYCEPGKEPVLFKCTLFADIQREAGTKGVSMFDEIIIRHGFDRCQSEISFDEVFEYWCKYVTCYHDLGRYLSEENVKKL